MSGLSARQRGGRSVAVVERRLSGFKKAPRKKVAERLYPVKNETRQKPCTDTLYHAIPQETRSSASGALGRSRGDGRRGLFVHPLHVDPPRAARWRESDASMLSESSSSDSEVDFPPGMPRTHPPSHALRALLPPWCGSTSLLRHNTLFDPRRAVPAPTTSNGA